MIFSRLFGTEFGLKTLYVLHPPSWRKEAEVSLKKSPATQLLKNVHCTSKLVVVFSLMTKFLSNNKKDWEIPKMKTTHAALTNKIECLHFGVVVRLVIDAIKKQSEQQKILVNPPQISVACPSRPCPSSTPIFFFQIKSSREEENGWLHCSMTFKLQLSKVIWNVSIV